MNKWLLTCAILLFVATGRAELFEPTLKFRVAAFFPTSERFRDIYGSSIADYQFEATALLPNRYRGWVNVSWLGCSGRSDRLHFHTTVDMTNTSIGISIPHQISENFSAYAGIGPSFGYVGVRNKGTNWYRNESKFDAGVLVKSGVVYDISCHGLVEFFIDYLYLCSTYRTQVNLGGLKIGGGIGWAF